jgi:hypothetical protein
MKKLFCLFIVSVILSSCAMVDEIYHMDCLKTVIKGAGKVGNENLVVRIERFDAKPADIRKYHIDRPTSFSLTVIKHKKESILYYEGYEIVSKSGDKNMISDPKYVKDWNLQSWGIPNEPLKTLLENKRVDKVIVKFKEGEVIIKPIS